MSRRKLKFDTLGGHLYPENIEIALFRVILCCRMQKALTDEEYP